MSKSKFYKTQSEVRVALEKLVSLTKEKSTFLTDTLQETKPPAKLLTPKCRDISYLDLPLSCLEYMWLGCDNASIKQKILAKAAYLIKVNESNHPRFNMLFTLEENMMVLEEEETDSINRYLTNKGGLL